MVLFAVGIDPSTVYRILAPDVLLEIETLTVLNQNVAEGEIKGVDTTGICIGAMLGVVVGAKVAIAVVVSITAVDAFTFTVALERADPAAALLIKMTAMVPDTTALIS